MGEVIIPVYLDTAATTAVAPEVLAAMVAQLSDPETFANPSSAHRPGQAAAEVAERARAEIAAELGCRPDEIVFTSGATESNNLALRGVAAAHADAGRHLITSRIEHRSVLACCAALERERFAVSYLTPSARGRIEPATLERALRPDTLLVSVMHVNNETGALQPIEEIAAIAAERGVLLHVDAAQSAGKLPIRLDETPIDLLSVSAHKFHGPKGIGCLVVRDRPRLRLQPLLYGGGQEFGLRPGTLPTHQIVGMASALRLAARRRADDLAHVAALKRRFLAELEARLPIRIHGDPQDASPYIVNFSLPGISSDALMSQLAAGLAMASGAACTSGAIEPSHVLRAMGVEGDALYGAVRASFDRDHSIADISIAAERIVAAASRIRELMAQ